MPHFAGLVLVLDVICLAHAVFKRQPALWYFVIVALPFVGATMYLLTELLPSARSSPTARRMKAGVSEAIDPDREVRAARQALEKLDTAENRKRLGDALVARKSYSEARDIYESALTGAHADDPHMLMGLSRALFGLEDYSGVRDTLDRLRAAWPDYQSPDGHMLYARAHEAMGELDQALEEYEALAGYYPGEEARLRYGRLLLRLGRDEEADAQFRLVIQSVESGSRNYAREQKAWYEMAKRQL